MQQRLYNLNKYASDYGCYMCNCGLMPDILSKVVKHLPDSLQEEIACRSCEKLGIKCTGVCKYCQDLNWYTCKGFFSFEENKE